MVVIGKGILVVVVAVVVDVVVDVEIDVVVGVVVDVVVVVVVVELVVEVVSVFVVCTTLRIFPVLVADVNNVALPVPGTVSSIAALPVVLAGPLIATVPPPLSAVNFN